jgi:hypothetical protein
MIGEIFQARKALKALKGIVKLQAIIRGRGVRRQAMSTLKCLQSIVSIQSQVISRKLQMVERKLNCGEHEKMQGSRDKIIRVGLTTFSRSLVFTTVSVVNRKSWKLVVFKFQYAVALQ